MYRMNLEEDVSSEEKMNTTNESHETYTKVDDGMMKGWTDENNTKVDDDTIDFTYRGGPSRANENEEHNFILETPVSKDTMNRSGTEKLYKLEQQNKKSAKEDKKTKKKKDKKDKKSKKHRNKKKSDEDEIIVANEELIESGNDFPTLPVSKLSNIDTENDTPYFMATPDRTVNQNQFDASLVANKDDTSKGHGKHSIPRPSIQQSDSQNTRKEDENHLVYRREDEKEDETDSTGTGGGAEVWPNQPQRYPSPERHYQEPYILQQQFQNNYRPALPLPPQKLQVQHGTLQRNNRVEMVGNPNMDPGGPFYASVATLQRDRAKGMTIVRGEKDGPIYYENPYFAMPQNKNNNRGNVQGDRHTQGGVVGFEPNGIYAPPPPPPSAIYGSHYAYNPYATKSKSKKKKAPEPPTWKDVRNAYLKAQVPEEDRFQKFSPNRHLEGLALAIGFIGMVLAVSLLLAYVIVQAPQLRRKIGPSLYVPSGESLEFDDNGSSKESLSDSRENRGLNLLKDSLGTQDNEGSGTQPDDTSTGPSPKKHYVIYGVEVGLSIFVGIMMITTNALLIHGVRKKYGPFLLPWLVFHTFFVAGLFAAVLLIICYVTPTAYKGFSALPGVAGLLLILCLIKVYKLRNNFMRQQRRRCGKVEELYARANASTYMNFGDNLYNPAPKIPDPDYSMG